MDKELSKELDMRFEKWKKEHPFHKMSTETKEVINCLKSDIGSLKTSDEINIEQHQEIIDKQQSMSVKQEEMIALLTPISETYKTVGRMAKWIMAFLVFLSVLGGVIWTWGGVFKSWFGK